MTTEHPGLRATGPHPRADGRSIVLAPVTGSQRAEAPESGRVAEARARANERLRRQRGTLRPLGWAVLLVVVLGSANSQPVPGLHGKALAVTLALGVFAATLMVAVRDGFPERDVRLRLIPNHRPLHAHHNPPDNRSAV
jgi:hypothetical protein